MCRHEVIIHACGHKEDIGYFCDTANSFGPLYRKIDCFYYSHGPERQYFSLCGKEGGFYCARTQDGVIIDGAKRGLGDAQVQLDLKMAEFERVVVAGSNYLAEAKMRGLSTEELEDLPGYRESQQQRQKVGEQCTILRNRHTYLNTLINHAWRNRERLQVGSHYLPPWDLTKFDFAHSVFTESLLQPIRRHLPGQNPGPIPPTELRVNSTPDQHSSPPQATPNRVSINAGSAMQPPTQTRSAPRTRSKLSTAPVEQANATTQTPSINPNIIRGLTPEGETKMEKALRYRSQLEAANKKAMAEAMTQAGYDVQTQPVRLPPKPRGKWHRPKSERYRILTDTKQVDERPSLRPHLLKRTNLYQQLQMSLTRKPPMFVAAREPVTISPSTWTARTTVPVWGSPLRQSQMQLGTILSTSRMHLGLILHLSPKCHRHLLCLIATVELVTSESRSI